MNELYVFYAIPKTGGTTINKALINKLNSDESFMLVNDKYSEYKLLSNEDKGKIKFIAGHRSSYQLINDNPGREIKFITFFREPAKQIISHYNFQMNSKFEKPISFKRWYYLHNLRNPQASHLMRRFRGDFLKSFLVTKKDTDAIKELLQSFYFVGVTEHIDMDAPLIFKTFNIQKADLIRKKVAGQHYTIFEELNNDLRMKLNKENKYDFDLYTFAQKLREDFYKSNSDMP